MLFATYQKCAWATNKTREDHRYFHMQMGFLDESAHICGIIKEARREQNFQHDVTLDQQSLMTEIGDSLWYLAALHSLAGQNLGSGMAVSSFHALDQWATIQPPLSQIDATQLLYRSTLHTASALEQHSPFPTNQCNSHLQALALFCRSQNINLGDAAEYNLQKIYGRYQRDMIWPENGFAFMKSLSVDFHQNAEQVTVKIGSNILGDPLTSQVTQDDSFNYHDSLHLAFATYLGWSPVLRKLTQTRRDDILDGARHTCNEEAVIDDIWKDMHRNPHYSGPGWNRLVTISDTFATHPEAGLLSVGQWEHAIKKGLEISAHLIKNGGGHVVCDFMTQNMTYTPH